ncbi:MAG: hypothetical protein IJN25_05675 [Clostridia bacterium]|nr:hypothetical protein [Clostridia bacterium]
MKKAICFMMALCTLLLFACTKDAPEHTGGTADTPAASAPAVKPQKITLATPTPAPRTLPWTGRKEFIFSSGAGAWATTLLLGADGTFSGEYSDSNAGESGEGHLATVYLSSFSGKFADFEKIDDYTLTMQLTDLQLEKAAGQEWIENEVKYVTSGAVGLEGGRTFFLYTPTAPLAMLPEAFVNWYPGGRSNLGTADGKLGCFGIYNQAEEEGLFSISA